jgi:hypothetical protein
VKLDFAIAAQVLSATDLRQYINASYGVLLPGSAITKIQKLQSYDLCIYAKRKELNYMVHLHKRFSLNGKTSAVCRVRICPNQYMPISDGAEFTVCAEIYCVNSKKTWAYLGKDERQL